MPRFREHHLHLPYFTFDNSKNIRLLYVVRVLRDFVNKSSLFFLPIFLYQLGSQSNLLDFIYVSPFPRGMLTIALYFIVQNACNLVLTIPSGKLIAKIGFERTFTLSYVFRILGFSFLYLTIQDPRFIIPAMLFEGAQSPLFWNSYHTTLSKITLAKHIGQDLGVLHFFLQLMAVIMPAIGGFLAAAFGLEMLFLVGLIGTVLGIIFSLMMEVSKDRDKVSLIEFSTWFKEREFKQLAVSYSGKYLNDSMLFLWPLYIFVLLGAIDKVGYLYTVSLFTAMLLSFFVGFYIDHAKSKKPFFATGGFISFLWLARTQVASVVSIAVVDTFDRLAANFHWMFFDSVFIRRAKGSQALSYFVYREVVLGIAGLTFWTVFGLFFYIGSDWWNSLFVFAAIGVLMSLLVRDKQALMGKDEL